MVRLLALGGEARLARPAPVELGLDLRRLERDQRRAAVDDAAEGRAVALAEGGDAEEVTEAVMRHGGYERCAAALEHFARTGNGLARRSGPSSRGAGRSGRPPASGRAYASRLALRRRISMRPCPFSDPSLRSWSDDPPRLVPPLGPLPESPLNISATPCGLHGISAQPPEGSLTGPARPAPDPSFRHTPYPLEMIRDAPDPLGLGILAGAVVTGGSVIEQVADRACPGQCRGFLGDRAGPLARNRRQRDPRPGPARPFRAHPEVEGQVLRMLVDTGATLCIFTARMRAGSGSRSLIATSPTGSPPPTDRCRRPRAGAGDADRRDHGARRRRPGAAGRAPRGQPARHVVPAPPARVRGRGRPDDPSGVETPAGADIQRAGAWSGPGVHTLSD